MKLPTVQLSPFPVTSSVLDPNRHHMLDQLTYLRVLVLIRSIRGGWYITEDTYDAILNRLLRGYEV
jgi:hypothetical protein